MWNKQPEFNLWCAEVRDANNVCRPVCGRMCVVNHTEDKSLVVDDGMDPGLIVCDTQLFPALEDSRSRAVLLPKRSECPDRKMAKRFHAAHSLYSKHALADSAVNFCFGSVHLGGTASQKTTMRAVSYEQGMLIQNAVLRSSHFEPMTGALRLHCIHACVLKPQGTGSVSDFCRVVL